METMLDVDDIHGGQRCRKGWTTGTLAENYTKKI